MMFVVYKLATSTAFSSFDMLWMLRRMTFWNTSTLSATVTHRATSSR